MAADLVYRIDASDRLISANEAWDESARAYGRPELAWRQLDGRTLWSQLSDSTVHDIYRQLVARAREGVPSSFPYRCDTAARRATFHMTIRGGARGEVEFTSTLLEATPRDAVRLLEANQPRDNRIIRMCGWCHAIAVNGAWVPLEQAVKDLRLLTDERLPALSHGICPSCLHQHFGQLKLSRP